MGIRSGRGTKEAPEPTVGRPRKYGNESTEPISVRLPQSVRKYLAEQGPSARAAVYEAVVFEKELTELLEDVRQDLLMSAALQGQEYSLDRAETIARLIRLGLSAERKPPKK